MDATQIELEVEWKRIQLDQTRSAIFADHELPFPSAAVASEPSLAGARAEPVVRNCEGPGATARTPAGEGAGERWRGLHTVAGLDVGYRNEGSTPEGEHAQDKAVACLTVLSFPDLEVLYTVSRVVDLAGRPYVPGFLSFREDGLADLVEELLAEPGGRAVPQVLFVDGNGRLHPRQAGSAVAIGVRTGLPTIGVAKEYFPVHCEDADGTAPPTASAHLATRQSLRAATRTLLRRRGDWIGLRATASPACPPTTADGFLGAALRSSPHAQGSNPVYVSSGHRVGLATALELVLACCSAARVPEPVRQADRIGRAEVRRIWG